MQYVTELNHYADESKELEFSKKLMIFNEQNEIREIDIIKNPEKATKTILELNNPQQKNRYKTELLELKGMLEDKIDKFPEIAKDITANLNIVSKEINAVDSINPVNNTNAEQTDIRLDVNDPDLYQDANRNRDRQTEIDFEEDLEEEQEVNRSRGRRR